uniref:AlNc14C264G9850 protein n=1 Tax=Albugo laibachii Nc14 TaxID=890382 RepID=F0WU27_9STRA|nr:AlNc14C264G9850 [Albugo laibachii Nc14]|eukprot:CCA24872.1 AlNc14C264G9850 [Albugo laibachii Nc14]
MVYRAFHAVYDPQASPPRRILQHGLWLAIVLRCCILSTIEIYPNTSACMVVRRSRCSDMDGICGCWTFFCCAWVSSRHHLANYSSLQRSLPPKMASI